MKAVDFLEPLPVFRPGDRFGRALRFLSRGEAVAIEEGDRRWHLLRPSDAVGYPDNRQMGDVRSIRLPTIAVSHELDGAALCAHPVWGVTKDDRLVGRIDRARVLEAVALASTRARDEALNREARDRLMQKVLHDLANVLVVAEMGDEQERSPAIDHARSLIAHMRDLYGDTRPLDEGASQSRGVEQVVPLEELLARISPMLLAAGRPAEVSVSWSLEAPALRCAPWRLESVLLNLVLNASELATSVVVRCATLQDGIEICVEDDGPGYSDEQLFDSPSPLRTQGRGLGLASVRRQVALLGGELRLEAGPEGGARARIRLPRVS